MGVDVTLMARTAEPLTDDELAALSAEYAAKFDTTPPDYEFKWWRIEREKYDNDGGRILDVSCGGYRYYGEHYERGPWPQIKAAADWLTVRLGETAEVRYGTDSLGFWDEIQPWVDQRDAIEAHWQRVGHHPYRMYGTQGKPCECEHCETIDPPEVI